MRDVEKLDYAIYLSESLKQDAYMTAYLQEAVLIAEGKNTIENIVAIQEGVVDKLKSGLAKIVEVFTRVWHKFVSTISKVFDANGSYLAKYKNLLLRQPARDIEWNMYKWNEKAVLNCKFPGFNYESMKENLGDKLTICQQYFGDKIPVFKNLKADANIEDLVSEYFQGGSEKQDIKESSLNIADMYNYCAKYNSIKSLFDKDIQVINTAATEAKNQINKIKDDLANKEKSTNESFAEYNFDDTPRYYYSYVYESVIQEATPVGGSSGSDSSVKPKIADDTNKPAVSASNMNANDDTVITDPKKVATDNKVGTQDVTKDVNAEAIRTSKEAQQAAENIENFIVVCTKISSCKIAAAQGMYKDYMDIMVAKVKYYTGKKDTDEVATSAQGEEKDLKAENKSGEEKDLKAENKSRRRKIFKRRE